MDKHPRSDLAADKALLVVYVLLAGTVGEEWTMSGKALFADQPHYPARVTPKPRIHEVQSAVVVGPAEQEIHTDEYGRVQVQFQWARDGEFDEDSFVWIRVSQGWAGGGYGMLSLPRVGHEVLVQFMDGAPDSPLVVGRAFNATTTVQGLS
jgi:type VI secretion system secreted protein VgrG